MQCFLVERVSSEACDQLTFGVLEYEITAIILLRRSSRVYRLNLWRNEISSIMHLTNSISIFLSV